MPEIREIKMKICLIGEGAVGKTSLIKRYVFDQFEREYLSTLGTKITKKQVNLKHPSKDEDVKVILMIWDIMGQKGFRELLQEAYFYGAQGLIAVCDITNKQTLNELEDWLTSAFGVTGKIPIIILGNKSDLKDNAQFGLDEIRKFASKYERAMAYLTSAKTGENVDPAFIKIGREILKR